MVAAAVVGSAVVGGVASNMAAKKQANAAGDAADMQQQSAQEAAQRLQPYAAAGQSAINPLWAAMGYNMTPDNSAVSKAQADLDYYTLDAARHPEWDKGMVQQKMAQYQQAVTDAQSTMQPSYDPNAAIHQKFSFNPEDLQNTPGYQFTLDQGLRQVNNSAAARGLGLSGAQLKGATSFATGLANQTYGDQYNRALSSYNTNYQVAANDVNRLQNMVNMGQNSAAQQGQQGITGAQGAGNYLTQGANASAAGTMGTANAATNGINNYMLYNALYK